MPGLVALALLSVPSANAADDTPWTDRITFAGDVRYRNEWSITRPGGADMRWRQRVRARLGLVGTILPDTLEAGIRLRTGNPGDPNSPHQTLGNDFASFTINLDKAYLKWNPGGGQSAIWAGKFANPFYEAPVYADTVWDQDINPDGVAARIAVVEGDGVRWSLNPAAYVLLEQDNGAGAGAYDTNDAYLFAGQSELSAPVGKGRITLANAFYDIPDTTPGSNPALLANNAGNAVNAAGTEYVSQFRILDNILGAKLNLGDQKLDLNARFLVNFGASSDNLGWQVGADLPVKAGKVGLKPFADVHAVQQEAFLGDLIGDDHQVGIGYLGAVAGLDIKATKGLGVKVWGIFDHSDNATSVDPALNSRVRIDVNGSF